MQELEEAERYSIAALFTLALHSVASSVARSSSSVADWGCVFFLGFSLNE